MNLQKLFELQRQLDERIMDEHPELRGQNNLPWKLLALQVELGECANEWRGFKKWSHDQEPRTEVKVPCSFCSGAGEGYFCSNEYTGQKERCIHCHGTGVEKTQNPLLEEYVDGLHFILSIGIDQTDVDSWFVKHNISVYKSHDVIKQFNDVFKYIQNFYEWRDDDSYEELFYGYFALGEMLGFTWQEIEAAYLQKNAINHERQESGY